MTNLPPSHIIFVEFHERITLMIITFIGHSSVHITDELSNKVRNAILLNISQTSPITFFCGGYGNFDLHCASICRKIRNYIPNCRIVFVTPYITPTQQQKMKNLIDEKMYDSIIYPPIENTPPRFAIIKRNKWMIDSADLIIAYVSQTYGGAYKSLKYAQKHNKMIINLAE